MNEPKVEITIVQKTKFPDGVPPLMDETFSLKEGNLFIAVVIPFPLGSPQDSKLVYYRLPYKKVGHNEGLLALKALSLVLDVAKERCADEPR